MTHLRGGNYSKELFALSGKLPAWLFVYNQATPMCADRIVLSGPFNPDLRVRLAAKSFVDDIMRVIGFPRWKIEYLLGRGKGLYLIIEREMADYSAAMGIKRFFAFTEFTNNYSHHLFSKLGYGDDLVVSCVKLAFLNISIVWNLGSGKKNRRFFFRSPGKDVTVI